MSPVIDYLKGGHTNTNARTQIHTAGQIDTDRHTYVAVFRNQTRHATNTVGLKI